MRTALLSAQRSTVFECHTCCIAFTYAAPVGSSGVSFPLFSSVMSVICLCSTGVLLFKISRAYKASLERGFSFYAQPITAIRAHRQEGNKNDVPWLLPWYLTYVVVNALFMLLGLVMQILSPPRIAEFWINVLLCGLCDFFDLILLFFLLIPRITFRLKMLAFVLSAVVGLGVAVLTIFADQGSDCPWCTQHFPVSSVSWFYVGQGLFLIGCCALARFRPFSYSPRPATLIYGMFWVPIYLGCGIVLPIMKYQYPDGAKIDWGFCVLGIIIVYYYVLLVPVQYYTITRDSAYVLKHGLDDDTAPAAGAEPHQLEEDARYLLEQESNEGLVELLRDASLSLIHAEDLEFLRRIGCGGFGEVYLARWNGTLIACKKLLAFAVSDETNMLREFVKEIEILSRLRHPNILLLVGFCIDKGSQSIISEYCSRGSVWNALHSPSAQDDFTMERRVLVASQVAAAMAYLHANNILHRDMKSPNILLTSAFEARVADFGMSHLLSAQSTLTGVGTTAWAAPETLSAGGGAQNSPLIDVYSYGVVVWELGTGLAPYDGMAPIQVAVGVLQQSLRLDANQFLENSPPVLIELFKQCTKYDPAERPPFSRITEMINQ